MMRKYLRFGAVLAASVLSVGLLFSFAAPLSPLADSVAHFRLHLLGCLTILIPLLSILRAGRVAAGAGAVILVAALVGLRPAWPMAGATAKTRGEITILQLNLLYRNLSPEAVLALIDREKPDVIAFQEVSRANRPLLEALRENYPHQQLCAFAGVGGVAVLSRPPPAPGAARGCAKEGGLAWLRVATPKGPVTAASLHLHWPYPFGQREQIDRLAPLFNTLPAPVLLGGDFNAAPWSHAAARVAQSTRTRILPGLRFTFHFSLQRRSLPIGMPIDHVLADPVFSPASLSVSEPVGSDHRAVTARLRWVE